VSLDLNTLEFGDASQSLVCICIYARFLRKNGLYSCQLIFSRTRVVPQDMSMPRAELYAALINAHTGEIIRRSFHDWHKHSIKFTDSQIALHWINNDQKPLKQWVRNRVIEILRFTSKDQWHYIQSKNMMADIGTRCHPSRCQSIISLGEWFALDEARFINLSNATCRNSANNKSQKFNMKRSFKCIQHSKFPKFLKKSKKRIHFHNI